MRLSFVLLVPWCVWLCASSLAVPVSGQPSCSSTAQSSLDIAQVNTPTGAIDLVTGSSQGTGAMFDGDLTTYWQPSFTSGGSINGSAFFHFAADGFTTAWLVTGFSVTSGCGKGSTWAYTLNVGIAQQATSAMNHASETFVNSVYVTSSVTTSYFQLQQPFISDGASLTFVTPGMDMHSAPLFLYEVRFYGIQVIPIATIQDNDERPACDAASTVHAAIDGKSLHQWDPCNSAGVTQYSVSFPLYNPPGDEGMQVQLGGILLQFRYDGAHVAKQATFSTYAGSNSWSINNNPSTPPINGYTSYTLTPQSSGWAVTESQPITVALQTPQYQPFLRQIALLPINSGSRQPYQPFFSVKQPSCVASVSAIQQLYTRYGASVGVMSHMMTWGDSSRVALENFWLTTPLLLSDMPSCFPYPYLPPKDTHAADLYAQVDPTKVAQEFWWTSTSPSGLDNAWGPGCSSCSSDPTKMEMYQYLQAFVQARQTITDKLSADLNNYWQTYYINRVNDIDAVTAFFSGPGVQFDINTFVAIQKELTALASAHSGILGIFTDVLAVVAAALPGLGELFELTAAAAYLGAAITTATTLTTLGMDAVSGFEGPDIGGSELTTPFQAVSNNGYLVQSNYCGSGACTNDLYFGQLREQLDAQAHNGAASVDPFIQNVLANYGQTMFFNAWYQGYQQGNPLYPNSVYSSLLQYESQTSSMWQAALGIRALFNVFTISSAQYSGDGQSYCYVNLVGGSGYVNWSDKSWDGLRNVFLNSPLGSSFFLSKSAPGFDWCADLGSTDGSQDESQKHCYQGCRQSDIDQLTQQIIPNGLTIGADPIFQSSIRPPPVESSTTCTFSPSEQDAPTPVPEPEPSN